MSEGQAYLEDKGFLPIEDSEYTKIFNLFKESLFSLFLWDEFNFAHPCSILNQPKEVNGKFTSLELKIDPFELNPKNEKDFVLSFVYKDFEFFVKGELESLEEEKHFQVIFKSDIYKIDQREVDRLEISNNVLALVFFHNKELFLGHDNIVYFNRKEGDLVSFLKGFQMNSFKDLFDEPNALPDKVASEIIGFKLLDLSNSGLSFLVNEEEKQLFDNKDKEFTMILNLKGKKYDILGGKIQYHTSISPSHLSSIEMHRIGMIFNVNSDLDEIIESLPMAPEGKKGFWNL